MYGKILRLLSLACVASGLPIQLGTEEVSDVVSAEGSDGDQYIVLFLMLATLPGLFVVAFVIYVVTRRFRSLREDDLDREEENQAYLELNLEEQELYFQSKDYLAANPYLRDELALSQNLSIQEKGIGAWEFVKDPMLTNNDLLIVSKHELNFFKKYECSAQTNLPIPTTNDVYYFESKIYSLPNPDETVISIGIGVKPYPWFRLPGRHAHTVSYDSNGYRRHNQPFKFESEPPFPKIMEGDVIGIGYRTRSGTVFFTRNGKKVSELKIGGHIKNFKLPHNGQIYPIVGANNMCSIHVNIGQLGYVFIEGNVKKWGFAPLEGSGPAPPMYNKFNGDILLERSEIDEENDLTDRENDFPPDFWDIHGNGESNIDQDKFSYNVYSNGSEDERITMHSLIPNMPPSYESDDIIEASSNATASTRNEETEHSLDEEAPLLQAPPAESPSAEEQEEVHAEPMTGVETFAAAAEEAVDETRDPADETVFEDSVETAAQATQAQDATTGTPANNDEEN